MFLTINWLTANMLTDDSYNHLKLNEQLTNVF